jgi:hypothetical protein
MLVHERHSRAVLRAGVVAAIVVVGVALYFGTSMFWSGSPPASPTSVGQPTNAVSASSLPPLAQAMNGTLSGTPPTDTSTPTPSGQTSTTTVGGIPPEVAAAVSSCQARWRLESAALAGADRSLSLWRRHLDIMNQLQAGRISLATAKAQWPSTTYKAAESVAGFRSADAALKASPETCAVDRAATGEAKDALRACAASSRTVDGALVAARVAIAPWEEHLKDQSHFAMGMVTPAAAEAAWRVMWKRGLATLPPYEKMVGGARSATCPLTQ